MTAELCVLFTHMTNYGSHPYVNQLQQSPNDSWLT